MSPTAHVTRPHTQPRQPSTAPHQSLRMSTQGNDNAKQSSRPEQSRTSQDANSSPPSFSLKDLGATTTSKIIIYAALSIAATAETVLWSIWLWEKFAPKSETKPDAEASPKENKEGE